MLLHNNPRFSTAEGASRKRGQEGAATRVVAERSASFLQMFVVLSRGRKLREKEA